MLCGGMQKRPRPLGQGRIISVRGTTLI